MEGEFLRMQLFEGQEQTPYLNVIEVKPFGYLNLGNFQNPKSHYCVYLSL